LEDKVKKGFTLIELLAVIVILAIIALIATPIVLNIIANTKENAQLRSAEMYLDAVEQSIMMKKMEDTTFNPNSCKIKDKKLYCNESAEELKVEVDGEKPDSGKITFTEGKIDEVTLTYSNGKTIVKNFNGEVVYKAKLSDICTLADGYTSNQIGAKYSCDFGAGAKNFYILELGTNPVSNTTLESDEVALILEGNYDTTTQYWCDQNGANPSNNVCAADGLTAKLDEIATAWTELERDQIGLPSMEQIMVADGKSETAYTDYPSLSNAWLYNWPDNTDYALGKNAPYGYWSSSPFVDYSSNAWRVYCSGYVSGGRVGDGDSLGVRPVITLKI
jgi:type IV pilus assembly protein PilA